MNDDEHIANIVRQSGLNEETCRNLLEAGWTYVRSIDEPSKWVDPKARIAAFIPHKEPVCMMECGVHIPHYHGFECSTHCPSCKGICHPKCPAYQKNGTEHV